MIKVIMFIMSLCIATHAAAGEARPPDDPYADRGSFRDAGPITHAERTAPWPSRDQAAGAYRDAFCRVWDDACTRCERKSSRVVDCGPIGEAATCERQRIVCKEMLSTQARVCLRFSDGCNVSENGNGAASAVLCDPAQATSRFWDYSCATPRGSHPTDDSDAVNDLAGHWWLVSPTGDTCVVTFNSIAGMGASEPCSPALKSRLSPYFNEFSPWPKKACSYETKGERLDIRCPAPAGSNGQPYRLTLSVSDLENPIGTDGFEGWRLLRISTLW